MKYVKYVLIFSIVLSSCKTQKTTTDMVTLKKESARKIVKKHVANEFNAETLDAKIKVRYTNNRGSLRKRHSFTVRMRIRKDSMIWMRGAKVVTAFKIKITPDSFSFYSPVSKEYFEGDYTVIKKILGIDISFAQLQDMLVGKSIFPLKGKRFSSEVVDNSYKLTPKVQEDLFDIFYFINPNHYKLDKLFLENQEKKQTLRIDYNAYTNIEDNYLPTKMMINATEKEDVYSWFDLQYKSLTLNKAVNTAYKIPSGYKRIEL